MLSDRFTADSKAEPNEPPCFPRDGTQRRLIREVKSTARGSYRPSTPDTPFLADQRGPSRPNHQNLHTRMAAGAALPCRLINLLTGEATICLGLRSV